MLKPEDLNYDDENVVNSEQTILDQRNVQAKVKIPEWLDNVESPFKWLTSLSKILKVYVHDQLTEKFLDYQNQGPDYGFEKFVLLLTLVCMDPLQNEIESNPDEEIDVEKTYADLEAVVEEMRCREGDVMYTRIGPALEHVLKATRANMLHLMGRDEESKQVARNLVPAQKMSLENKAAFEGIKAKFIVHLHYDGPDALQANKKAIELDPNFAYWKYFIAKIMRRERRNLNEDMTFEELEYFEKAVEIERNPKFLVFLAQANQEMAWVLAKHSSRAHITERMFQKALNLYRECWKLKNDSAPIARRVGNGMRKISYDLKNIDLELAKEALLKAIELSPSIDVTFHTLGKIYLEENNEEKALKYFNHIKGDFCTGEIIRLKLIKDPESDISDHIQYLIEFAEGFVKQDLIYCDLAWYYLCFKGDLDRASFFIWKVLKREPDSCRVLNYTTYVFFRREPINLLEVLVNEIKLFLKNNEKSGDQDIKVLSTFLEKIYVKHPLLREMNPDPDLLRSIKIKIESFRSHLKRFMDMKTNSSAERQNIAGSWRKKENNVAAENENQEELSEMKGNGAENWRGQSSALNQNNDNHNGWYRARYSTRDYRETSLDIDMETSGNRATDKLTDSCSRETDRYRETDRNRYGFNEYKSKVQNDNRRNYDQRNQSYNISRYDTTITNWRTGKRQ